MPIRQRTRGFQVDLTVKGTRVRAQFNTLPEAQAFELETLAAAKLGKPLPQPPNLERGRPNRTDTIAGLVSHVDRVRWSANKSGDCSLRDARFYADHVGPDTLVAAALTTDAVADYVDALQGDMSGRTINRRLAAVSVLVKEAQRMGAITHAVIIPKLRDNPPRTRWYTDDEVRQIINMTAALGRPEYASFWRFLADTGCRLSEARRLVWRDVRGNRVVFRDTKNGDDRMVVLTPLAQEAMQLARTMYPGSAGPWHFVTLHAIKTVWGQLRGRLLWMDRECVVHTLRHTCASKLVQDGEDPANVGRWLGHRSPQATAIYAHLAPRNFEAMAARLAKQDDGVSE